MPFSDLFDSGDNVFLFTVNNVVRAKISLRSLKAGIADITADHSLRAFQFAGLSDDRPDRSCAKHKHDVVFCDPGSCGAVLSDGKGLNEGGVLPRDAVTDLIYIRFFDAPVFSPSAVCS